MNPWRLIVDRWRARRAAREERALNEVKARYHAFRVFLENNGRALELVIDLDRALARGEDEDLPPLAEALLAVTLELVDGLNLLSADAYEELFALHGRMSGDVRESMTALERLPHQAEPCLPLGGVEPSAHRLVGSKAANLATLRRMGLPVPDGFVCTVRACRRFLEQGGIDAGIRRAMGDVEAGRSGLAEAAAAIRDMILAAPLPPDLAEALSACRRAMGGAVADGAAVSVRSSGVAEDTAAHSFAGQYTSVLNVVGDEALFDAFREVVASGFGVRAMAYRQRIGMDPAAFDLAVLVQGMVRARAAGVLMTRDPGRPGSGRMLVSAVPGLGTLAVGGAAPADLYRPRRSDAPGGEGQGEADVSVAVKTVREVADGAGGVREEAVPEAEREAAILSPEQVGLLARYGEMVESLHGMPQDIEWALDEDGNIHLLQARPLRVAGGGAAPAGPLAEPLVTGMCASAGKAVGRVLPVRGAAELEKAVAAMPESEDGTRVLVLPQSVVEASPYLTRFAGLVVDQGNPTDHLSCIARELGLPVITGAAGATRTLRVQQWVVLDADNGQVTEASPELWSAFPAQGGRTRSPARDGTARCALDPPREALRRRVAPLNLTDAYGPTFSLAQCRSLHDLIRYTHEMAVLAMFYAGDMVMEEAGGLLHPLDIGVPFHFLVVDVGGGLRRDAPASGVRWGGLRRRVLGPGDILSRPLAALCEGLATPGLSWHPGAVGAALSGLFSRNMLDAASARPVGSFNYALAARDYLNLNSRVEYHFAMLDAVCGGSAQANYVRFRFKGGGTSAERTSRRALFLREVLEESGFVTSVKGDLVTASLTGAGRETVRARLVMLGRLIGFSRCLDAVMGDDGTARRLARGFLAGVYDSSKILEEDVQA